MTALLDLLRAQARLDGIDGELVLREAEVCGLEKGRVFVVTRRDELCVVEAHLLPAIHSAVAYGGWVVRSRAWVASGRRGIRPCPPAGALELKYLQTRDGPDPSWVIVATHPEFEVYSCPLDVRRARRVGNVLCSDVWVGLYYLGGVVVMVDNIGPVLEDADAELGQVVRHCVGADAAIATATMAGVERG